MRWARPQGHGADAQDVMATGSYPFILPADDADEHGFSRRANKARRENTRQNARMKKFFPSAKTTF